MITIKMDTCNGSGWRIFSMEDCINSYPINKMRIETINPEMYSIRPCPKGWSESGFWPAILKPIKVMIDDAASDKLLNASAVTAMELLSTPAKNLKPNNKRLKKIPHPPQTIPYFWRVTGSLISVLSLIKKLMSKETSKSFLFLLNNCIKCYILIYIVGGH